MTLTALSKSCPSSEALALCRRRLPRETSGPRCAILEYRGASARGAPACKPCKLHCNAIRDSEHRPCYSHLFSFKLSSCPLEMGQLACTAPLAFAQWQLQCVAHTSICMINQLSMCQIVSMAVLHPRFQGARHCALARAALYWRRVRDRQAGNALSQQVLRS